MIRLISIFGLVLITYVNVAAQHNVSWDQLADVTWSETYVDSLGYNQITGTFGQEVQNLDGKEITISGYVIPLDGMGLSYALSKSSFASCFFCGQAGPETVMDLNVTPRSIKPHRQKETLLTFRGILKVRESNDSGLHYTLDQASEVELSLIHI